MKKNLALIALGATLAAGGQKLLAPSVTLASSRLDLVNLQLTKSESINLADGGTGPGWVGRACAYEYVKDAPQHTAEPCWSVQLEFQQLGPIGVAILDQRK